MHLCFCWACVWFGIRNVLPWDSSVCHACFFHIFTSQGTEFVKKQFPMCFTWVWGGKDSAWLSNLTKSPINIPCCITNTDMTLFQYSSQHVEQNSSEAPVEKRPHWEMAVEINKAIFCWVSKLTLRLFTLRGVWGVDSRDWQYRLTYVGWHIALVD